MHDQLLVNKCENEDLKHYNDPKGFMEYFNGMKDVHKHIDEYNLGKERKILSV